MINNPEYLSLDKEQREEIKIALEKSALALKKAKDGDYIGSDRVWNEVSEHMDKYDEIGVKKSKLFHEWLSQRRIQRDD